MKKYRSYLWALIAVLAVGMIVTACGKDKGSGGVTSSSAYDMPSSSSAPAAEAAPATAPAPQGVAGGRDGVAVEKLSSDFADGRCTDLSDPMFAGKEVFVEVARVTNNTGGQHALYDKTALYQTRRATCDAHADNPAGAAVTDPMVTGEQIPNGESREWTHRFVVPRNFCGSMQLDNDARNGEVAVSTLNGGAGGYVINSGRDCLDCEFFGLQVLVSGDGLTRNVTVNFDHPKAQKTATVDFGDGSAPVEFKRGETKSHTFPPGDWTITATVEDREQDEDCVSSASITVKKPCEDMNVWTVENERRDGPYTIIIATDKNNPAGSMVEAFSLNGGEVSPPFYGYDNMTLHAFFQLPKFQTIYWYWYDGEGSGIQNDCENEGGTYYYNPPGDAGRRNVCATTVNHGDWWEYDHRDWAKKYKTTEEKIPDGFKYDFADSETSNSCGVVEESDVEALWKGDAKLRVSCECLDPKQLPR